MWLSCRASSTDHAFDHVGVFTYSHEEGTSAHQLDDDVPAKVKAGRRNRVMGLRSASSPSAPARRFGERTRIVVDGPSPEHELVLKGRLATQAPDIDACVFLTECDPSRFRPGDFADVELVGARTTTSSRGRWPLDLASPRRHVTCYNFEFEA